MTRLKIAAHICPPRFIPCSYLDAIIIMGLARFLWENRKFRKKERLFKRIHDIFRIEVVIFRCATIDRKPVLLEFFGVDAIHR